MTKIGKKRILAGLACMVAAAALLPAALWAYPAAEDVSGAEYTFQYTDTAGKTEATGLKITLPATDRTAEYIFTETVDAEDMANAITLRMLPEQSSVRDAARMLVTFTDALDEEQSLTVSVVYGNELWWGTSTVTAMASYTDDLTFDTHGFGSIVGTSQKVYGKDSFTGENNYKEHGTFPVGVWEGDDIFSGSIDSVCISYADCKVNIKGTNEWMVANLTDAEFLQKSTANLPNTDAWNALKEKYTAEFAQNLFSSGKVKVKVKFMDVSSDIVSFLLQSLGEKSYADVTELSDTSGPAIGADFETNALKGFSYSLPVPKIADNTDGAISEYSVEVKDPAGVTVYSEENAAGKENIFVPESAGNYTVTYTAKDVSGNETAKNCALESFASVPAVTFEKISGSEPQSEYITFDSVVIPAYGASSALSLASGGAMAVQSTVVKDGVTLAAFENAGTESVFVPETAGEYSVVYTAVDAFGLNLSETMYSFTVEEGVSLVMEQTSAVAEYGTSFSVPKVLGVYKNRYEPAAFDVVSPSLKKVEVAADRTFALEEIGDYVITFRHEADGKTAVKTFTLASVYPNDTLFYGDNLDVLQGNYTIPDYAEQAGQTGVLIGSSSTEEFSFANHIDVNDLTKNDNLLQFVPYADGGDYTEFAIRIILTDVYDANNKVIITVQPHPEQNGNATWAFIHVNYDGRTLSFNTESSEISDSATYGCLIGNSMGGGYGTLTNVKPISVQFDGSENAVYVTTNFAQDPWCVLDTDRVDHVGAGREWKGFTTGEVTLTLQFENIRGKSAGMIVTEVAGHSVQGASVADDSAPVIYTEENAHFEISDGLAPAAEVNSPYPLLDARAHDPLFGEIECEYSLKLRGEDAELYGDVSEGVFIPQDTGIYDYTVTARNLYGKETVYAYSFEAKAEIGEIEFSFAEEPANATAGSWFVLPEILAENGSGKKTISVSATLNGKDAEINALGEIYLFEAGELVLTLSAEDYLGTAAKNDTLTVEVAATQEPVMDISGMPSAALKGQNLLLPDFTAIDYSAAADSADYHAYREVRVNGTRVFSGRGEEVSGSLVYAVTESGFLTVVYAAGTDENNILVQEEFILPVVEGNLDLYFLPYDESGVYSEDGVTASVVNTDVRFTVTQDKTLKFANPLAADGLVLEFGTVAGATSFTRLVVRLEDYENAREAVKLIFTATDGTSFLTVNDGGTPVPVTGSLTDGVSNFYFRLSNFDRCLYNNLGDLVADIGAYENGLPFTGFSSGRVRVSYEIDGVNGSGSLRVVRMGNQSFAGAADGFTDNVAPQIVFEYEMPFSQDAEIGAEVLVSAAFAADVLQSEASVTLTVMSPAGVIIDGLQNAPCDQTRTLVFETYGSYYVVYTMTSGGVTENYRSIVNVRDRIAPEITVSGSPASSGKAGEAFAIPAAEASDNHSETQLFVFILRPDGKLEKVSAGENYTFVQSGKHRLVYYAYDEEYNVSVREYEIDVTEG